MQLEMPVRDCRGTQYPAGSTRLDRAVLRVVFLSSIFGTPSYLAANSQRTISQRMNVKHMQSHRGMPYVILSYYDSSLLGGVKGLMLPVPQ